MKSVLPTESQEESIPQAIIPYNRDDDRCRYLGLRASGFTIREALGLIGKAKSTLSAWRHDEKFLELEDKIPELRKTLALEYASLEFLRNYRLVLEKDYRVVKSSLEKRTVIHDSDGKPHTVPMDSQDYQYLLKMRAHYTPQQLQAIESLFGNGSKAGEITNFTDFVLLLSRKTVTEEVAVGTRKRSPSELGTVSGEE